MTLSVSDSSLLGSIQKTRCKVKTFGKVTVYNSVANTATCRTIDYTLTFSFAPPHLLEQNLTNKEKKQRKTLDDGTNFILKFFFVCCRSVARKCICSPRPPPHKSPTDYVPSSSENLKNIHGDLTLTLTITLTRIKA